MTVRMAWMLIRIVIMVICKDVDKVSDKNCDQYGFKGGGNEDD